MDSAAVVGAGLCLLVLGRDARRHALAIRERRANCDHRWDEPTVFAGYWTRHCKLCGAQAPWTPPSGDADDG